LVLIAVSIIVIQLGAIIHMQSNISNNSKHLADELDSYSILNNANTKQSLPWFLSSSEIVSTNSISLYNDSKGEHIYGRIPVDWVEYRRPLLLIEQITHGIGLQSLFWDPGSILSQNLCIFSFSNQQNKTVILQLPNINYRSKNESFIERSFSSAIIWSGAVLYSDSSSVWVDLQDLFQMPPGILGGRQLPAAISGVYGASTSYSIDESRSFTEIVTLHSTSASSSVAVDFHATFVLSNSAYSPPADFTDNLPIGQVLSTTVRRTLHGLEDSRVNKFRSRQYHPKSGFNYISFMNEDTSIFENRQELLVVRHQVSSSEGILYLVDSLIPEPYRSAVLTGIRWWDEAFQAAGYPSNTIRAEVAPASFDPYDLFRGFDTSKDLQIDSNLEGKVYSRVHFVQWIDRDIRSYSVGLRVIDPRSGEILRGHVRLEGLRLRQDALLAEALLAPYASDGSFYNGREDITRMVLQRVKHLAAHEVGHSLGLAHNFAGSTSGKGDTSQHLKYASVMDYPPPFVRLDNNSRLILNQEAYSDGIGSFDNVSIRYAYEDWSAANGSKLLEWTWLQKLIVSAEELVGYVFITDQDSGTSSADWRDTKWDSGGERAIEALQHALKVRREALQHLGVHVLHNASAFSSLHQVLPIIYLWHRYEAEAVTKLIGGHSVQYSLRNDLYLGSHYVFSQPANSSVQLKAIDMIIDAMMPANVAVPLATLATTSQTTAFGFQPDIGGIGDVFSSRTGLGRDFDPLIMYQANLQLLLSMLLDTHRLERIAQQSFLFDATVADDLPGIDDLFDRVFAQILPSLEPNETCEFLAQQLSNEYFILLTVWKATLQSIIEKNKVSSSVSTLTLAGLQRGLLRMQQQSIQLEQFNVLICNFEQLFEKRVLAKPSPQQLKVFLRMLQSLSTLTSPSPVNIPNGPPI
jgi:hypothetical protein